MREKINHVTWKYADSFLSHISTSYLGCGAIRVALHGAKKYFRSLVGPSKKDKEYLENQDMILGMSCDGLTAYRNSSNEGVVYRNVECRN